MNTTWNLALLYKSPQDPQIDKDVKKIISAYKSFEKKWKTNNLYTKNAKVLGQALNDYEQLLKTVGNQKPVWYFQLLNDIHQDHPIAGARSTQLSQQLTEGFNRVLFFNLNLATIDKKRQGLFLKAPNLVNYKYHLEKIFKQAKYNLSESEEKILNLTDTTSYEMWVNGVQKLLGAQKIEFKGKEIGIGEAAKTISTLPRNERGELYHKMMSGVKNVAPFAEGEMNAVLTIKKISDELRGYTHSYSSAILANQNDEKSILHFSKIVTQHFSISKRFFKIKKKMLGITDPLKAYDLAADVGKINKKFSFEDSVAIVREAFDSLDPQFSAILDRYVENGQVDVFPRMHKRAGAYCWKRRELPTFVLLNHVPEFDSVQTLAHEMGHAIHGELSKTQPTLYESYTTATAEVASTFFEKVSFDYIWKTLSPEDQIIALHEKIFGGISTIFTQIAFFNFEIELHETLRATGFVAKEKISELMVKHRLSYVDDILDLDPEDGLFWVRLSHIRSYFYVYTYAYGELISNAMYANYQKDPSFVSKIKKFLSAGGSNTPEKIFKSIGIDTTKDEFWISGLKAIDKDIALLEKMVDAQNKSKNKKQA